MENKEVKRILICTDEECRCKKSKDILEELQKELNNEQYNIKGFSCLGACGLAPVAMIDNKLIGKISKEKILELLK